MDVRDKIVKALRQPLKFEYIRLEDEDGITGVVVSRLFENRSSLDRQEMIEEALGNAPDRLNPEERRRVLMIAGLTPLEYSSVGPKIRVQRLRKIANGVEVILHGGVSDAEYVRGALNHLKGVTTSEPKPRPGAEGVLMAFHAVGHKDEPLTTDKAIRALKRDPYIDVMPDA